MTACGAIGALTVGGKVVGQLRCKLVAGHDDVVCACGCGVRLSPVHAFTLTWAPEAEPPDLDLFDPDERFDVDVPG